MIKALRAIFLLFPILTLLCSCEDSGDDYRYPSVCTDFACVATDGQGYMERMYLDNGNGYPVHLTDELLEAVDNQPPTYKRDTLYRTICVYELVATEQGDTVADIYSIGSVLSSVPTPLAEDEKLWQDPVYLQSIWQSGGYLNFALEIKALDGKHSIGFVDTTPEGMHGKEFTFYHKVISDVESYRQKLYGSIPLLPFRESLQPNDTLRFVVNLYDKGIATYEFVQSPQHNI